MAMILSGESLAKISAAAGKAMRHVVAPMLRGFL